MNELPILYSFRRCPYAMRARMALAYAGIAVEHREVDLRNKPIELLNTSPKGTVPVLVLQNKKVIDQSLDIIMWALAENDPDNWMPKNQNETQQANALIEYNDNTFATSLTRYKYADRYPEHTEEYYRKQAELFIQQLENLLSNRSFLICNNLSFADVAIMPFVRQFAHVDNAWFAQSSYKKTNQWLVNFLKSELFVSVMTKIKLWKPSQEQASQN